MTIKIKQQTRTQHNYRAIYFLYVSIALAAACFKRTDSALDVVFSLLCMVLMLVVVRHLARRIFWFLTFSKSYAMPKTPHYRTTLN
jgi:hypothetical protein